MNCLRNDNILRVPTVIWHMCINQLSRNQEFLGLARTISDIIQTGTFFAQPKLMTKIGIIMNMLCLSSDSVAGFVQYVRQLAINIINENKVVICGSRIIIEVNKS